MTLGEQIKARLQELDPNFQEITPNTYDDEELSLEEVEEALRIARQKKHDDRKKNEYINKIRTAETWSRPTARDLYERLCQTISQTGDRYEVNDHNKQLIFSLCLYFAGDERFKDRGEGFSLQKGICITGKPGTGKSHLMAFFSKNPLVSYAHITCTAVAERYRTSWQREGIDTLEWYSLPLKANYGHIYGQTELGYCFGDLGTEGDKSNFGNKLNVMEHIIFQRYENKLPFNQTHITTNLNAAELEKAYGPRVRDRIREMCNWMPLEGKSFR